MNKIVKSDAEKPSFQTDIETIRVRARVRIERGAVTAGYSGDRVLVIDLLNDALASEIVCVLRYKRHYYSARGSAGRLAATEFLEHANEEQQHADRIAERIAIESYREMVRYFGDRDPTSRRMMEEILAVEEEHADDLVDLLHDVPVA
jgi:bacterioferritin